MLTEEIGESLDDIGDFLLELMPDFSIIRIGHSVGDVFYEDFELAVEGGLLVLRVLDLALVHDGAEGEGVLFPAGVQLQLGEGHVLELDALPLLGGVAVGVEGAGGVVGVG